jgi:hypothetical protein
MATGYWLDSWGSITGRGKTFLRSTSSRPPLGPTKPPIQWTLAVLSPGVKRPRREADQSPPFRAEVKKGGATYPVPHASSWHSA